MCGPRLVSPEIVDFRIAQAVIVAEGSTGAADIWQGGAGDGGVSDCGTDERGQPRNLGGPTPSTRNTGDAGTRLSVSDAPWVL